MQASVIDLLIIVAYLSGITAFGIFVGGKQNDLNKYFLGSRSVKWWAVCLSIVAAETSSLTFISIPGLAYIADLSFLQVAFGYLLGRIFVAKFLLPAYYADNLETAYSFLENRFGKRTRVFSSIVFLFTRTAADGVRLFATAIPLKLLLGIDYPLAIFIIAAVSLIYTSFGGIRGIIFVDVVQMAVYLIGAIISFAFIMGSAHVDGFSSFISIAGETGKLKFIELGAGLSPSGFFKEAYTLFGGLIGGAFLSMASHGTDQLIVQRLLSIKKLKDGQKAIIGSGVIVIIQFFMFLILGAALFSFYGKMDIRADEIFPKFIIEELPTGVSGFLIAGLFASAMSTLAGSISSLSSSTVYDLLPALKLKINSSIKNSRIITVIWSVMLIFSALFFMESSRSVVEIALGIASFTYGGLLGTFLLGIFVKNAQQKDAIAAFIAGILGMIIVVLTGIAAWTWYTVIGVIITLLAGFLLSRIRGKT